VSHVVALHEDGFEDLQPVARIPGLLVEPVRLFRVPGTFPRVYAVGGARVADGREGLRVLTAADFDPRREVLLSGGEPSAPPPSFAAQVRTLEWRPDRIRLEAALGQPGYLVLAEGYDPGWSARLDGRAVPVLRANLALRAVATPAGTHLIELVYRPLPLAVGLGISAAALLVGAGFGVRWARARAA